VSRYPRPLHEVAFESCLRPATSAEAPEPERGVYSTLTETLTSRVGYKYSIVPVQHMILGTAGRGVQILDRARPDHDPGHCWRLASHA
jgi:hypothetical protein